MATRTKLYALTLLGLIAGCSQPFGSAPAVEQPRENVLTPLKDAFQADGLLAEKVSVVVRAMVEDQATVELRARSTGLKPETVRPKAYGFRILVAHKNAEVGTAFFSRMQIYHLESMPGQIIIDRRYLYGMGFATPDVINVNEKTWSERYSATEAEINQLDALAEAVHAGRGAKAAYEATQLFGSLSKSGAEEENTSERSVTWLAGRQDLEDAVLNVVRSEHFGNRLDPAFVAAP